MTYVNNHLLSRFSQHNTRLTPGEIVHLPERVQGEEEREGRNGEDIEQHPANHIPLPPHDEHEGLDTIDGRNHDQRQRRDGFAFTRDQVNEIDNLVGLEVNIWSGRREE